MLKTLSNLSAIISAFVVAFCWKATILLASLGLGSFTVSRWIQTNKLTFLAIALSMMTLSLFSAVNEKRKKNKNTGLIAFGLAMTITGFLLSYNKVKYGFWI